MSEHEAPTETWLDCEDEPVTIGGHASAAIATMHPHLRPIDVYRRMVEHEVREPAPEMEWGLWIEPLLLEWAARKLLEGQMNPATKTRSARWLWAHACPDAKFAGNSNATAGLVSAKHVGGYRARFWGSSKTDRIPAYAAIQEQLYMGILDEPVSYVVAAIGGKAPELWAVPFDQGAFDAIIELDEAFLRRHIIPKKPPPPDGSTAYKRWIAERVTMKRAELIAVDGGEMRAVIEEYRARRIAADEAAHEREVSEQKIKVMIGDAGGIELTDSGEKITFYATKKVAASGNPVRQFRVPDSFKASKGDDE